MISVAPAKVEQFVAKKLEEVSRRKGVSLSVSGHRLEADDQVTVYVRPHDHNLSSEAFVGEFALIEEEAESEFAGVSVVLVPDYACD